MSFSGWEILEILRMYWLPPARFKFVAIYFGTRRWKAIDPTKKDYECCWLVWFYGASTLFGSFNAELSHFDKVSNNSVLYKYTPDIDMMVTLLAPQWPGRPGFNPRSNHTKDTKRVLDTSLFNTQHYKVRINGKMEQSSERSSALPYTLV